MKDTRYYCNSGDVQVLAVDGVIFTNLVEKALIATPFRGLSALELQLTQEVSDVIGLIQGDISPLNRLTLASLIVVDVHSRDVVASLMAEDVRNVADFAWQSQLRYVFDASASVGTSGDGGSVSSPPATSMLSVLQMTTKLSYGFEYLVNPPPPVQFRS